VWSRRRFAQAANQQVLIALLQARLVPVSSELGLAGQALRVQADHGRGSRAVDRIGQQAGRGLIALRPLARANATGPSRRQHQSQHHPPDGFLPSPRSGAVQAVDAYVDGRVAPGLISRRGTISGRPHGRNHDVQRGARRGRGPWSGEWAMVHGASCRSAEACGHRLTDDIARPITTDPSDRLPLVRSAQHHQQA